MLEGRYAPQALSLLRIVAALIFLLHGSSKILGFPATEMGAPPVGSLFWIGGLLLLVGLFSRPVAFILSGEMAVAYWMVHAPQSTFPMINGGDAAILYCFVFLLIAAASPGPWSIDASLRRRRTEPVRDIDSEDRTTLP